MIKKLRVKNFKALRDVEIELTPIHVLIGPNDTGKTSILEILAALCRSVNLDLSQAFLGSWKGTELVWAGSTDSPVEINVDFDVDVTDDTITGYGLSAVFGGNDPRKVTLQKESIKKGNSPLDIKFPNPNMTSVKFKFDNPSWSCPESNELEVVRELLEGVHFYRWNPEFIALPVAPDSKRRFRMESNGFGLALCLDDILSFDRKLFAELEKRFNKVFPDIESIILQQEKAYRSSSDINEPVTMLQHQDGKGIYFKLKDVEQLVPASQASDGTLLLLAYLTVLYLPQPPRVLLVEEPENGIHPKRLGDVLRVLRYLVHEQSHTQIILTTHSPYVLDLFEPDEVTLCTKLDNGEIKTTRLSDSPIVKSQRDIFTLGEIWTSEGDENISNSKSSDGGSAE